MTSVSRRLAKKIADTFTKKVRVPNTMLTTVVAFHWAPAVQHSEFPGVVTFIAMDGKTSGTSGAIKKKEAVLRRYSRRICMTIVIRTHWNQEMKTTPAGR